METLKYIRLSEDGPADQRRRVMIIIQMTGGGATVMFRHGDPTTEVCSKLRSLADILEDGEKQRAGGE
jgi:hypothetical protein